jgi:hypothetical protein
VRHLNKLLWAVAAFTLIPVLYLVLLGPLLALTARGVIPEWAWHGYLYPLHLLGMDNENSFMAQMIAGYLRLWIPN